MSLMTTAYWASSDDTGAAACRRNSRNVRSN
jgi:hypothetical protein